MTLRPSDSRPRPTSWRRRPAVRWSGRRLALRLGLVVALALGAAPLGAFPSGAAPPARATPEVAAPVDASRADRWQWPVPVPHPVVGPYRAPATRYAAGHRGIDIGAAAGTLVRSPADGTVHFAGIVVDRPLVSIEVGEGTLIALEPVEPAVAAGDTVHAGDPLGSLEPGHCAGPCLHLGVRVDGDYVSPLRYLGGVPRAVLLPVDRDP